MLSKFSGKIIFSLFIFITFSCFVLPTNASAATYYVDGTRPDDTGNGTSWATAEKTLTAALTDATTGDTIELSGGVSGGAGQTYPGKSSAIATNTLTIKGSTQTGYNGTVTIDCNSCSAATVKFTGSSDTLQNVTVVTTSASGNQYALELTGASPTITNVTINNARNSTALRIDSTATSASLNTVTINESPGSGSSASLYALDLTAPNAIFKNMIIYQSQPATAAVLIESTGTNAYFENFVLAENGNTGYGISLTTTTGTTTFNNATINGTASWAVYFGAASTVKFTNSVFTNIGGDGNADVFHSGGSGGTVNTTNSFVQGAALHPQLWVGGTNPPTWNSTNDILNGFPYYYRTKANVGYITFFTDDLRNYDYLLGYNGYTGIANLTKPAGGRVPMTWVVNELDASDSSANALSSRSSYVSEACEKGVEIAAHNTDHTDMSQTNALSVTYTGAGTSMAVAVSGSGTSLSITGTADTHGPIDLTNASYDTLGELVTLIKTWSNFTAALTANGTANYTQAWVPSNTLKDATTSFSSGTASIPFDDSTDSTNRLYSREITKNINDLNTILQGDPACVNNTVKTLSWPFNTTMTAAYNWVKSNAGLTSVRTNRSNVPTAGGTNNTWLGHINLFAAYASMDTSFADGTLTAQGTADKTTYDNLSASEKASRMQQAARVMATHASNGFYVGMLNHNDSTELSTTDLNTFITELYKYTSAYNLTVDTQANIINTIKTSGSWAVNGSDSDYWDRTFSGSDDFRLTSSSPMINVGIGVTDPNGNTRTTDILGNSIVGTADIGAYEFQSPAAPTSLTQYRSDGITSFTSGDYTNETSVVFKFSMSSTNVSDSLTPQIEIQPIGTAFTNTFTNSGTAVAYAGSPVTGTVTVTGLTNGVNYHWQARVSNAAGAGSYTSSGGNPDFIVDTSAPTISAVSSGTPASTGATITWTTNEIASSKVNYGLTSSYGNNTTETDTSPRVTPHSVALSGLVACTAYHYRVRSKDAAANETIDGDNTFTTSGCTGSAAVDSQTASSITTASGGSVSLLSGSTGIALTVPASFADSDATFQIKQMDKTATLNTTSTPSSGTARGYGSVGSYIYQLSALTDTATSLSTFNQPITVTVTYGSSDVTNIDESTLKIFRWDGSSWNQLSGCSVNTSAKTVSCTTSNFSTFGLFGQTTTHNPGPGSAPSCNDTTPTGVPNLFQISTIGSSAKLTFTTLSSGVTGYNVSYGLTLGEEKYSTDVSYTGPLWMLDTTINNLAANTTYYFKVRAKNGCTAGSWSNNLSAKTLGAVAFNNLGIVSSELVPQTNTTVQEASNCKSPYTVKSGDSLWSIAQDNLGDGSKFQEIIEQNKAQYSSLATSNNLSIGWELKVNCGAGQTQTGGSGTGSTQTQGGYDLKVKVSDTNKKPVEGAKVTIHSKVQEATTNKDGIAEFSNIEAGEHKVLIAYNNFQGELSVNLTGAVKEFDLNVSIKPQSVLLSPIVMEIIGALTLIVVVLGLLLLKAKKANQIHKI